MKHSTLTTVTNRGKVTCRYNGLVEDDTKPYSRSNNVHDVYLDVFDTLEEASQFIQESKKA